MITHSAIIWKWQKSDLRFLLETFWSLKEKFRSSIGWRNIFNAQIVEIGF